MSLALALDKLGNELLFALSRRVAGSDRHRGAQSGFDGGRRIARRRSGPAARSAEPPCSVWPAPTRSACSVTQGQVLHPLKSMSMVLGIGIDLPAGPLVALRRLPLGAEAARCRAASRPRPCFEPRHEPAANRRRRRSRFTFPQLERDIASHAGETIYQSARRSGVRIIGACGGRGTCGTCRVHIVEGEIDASADETAAGAAARNRTGCAPARSTPKSDCAMEIAARSLAPVVRAEFDAGEAVEMLPLDAAVVSRDISVPQATLADNLSDLDRVLRALAMPLPAVDLAAARQLPAVLRAGDWSLRAHIRERELIGFAPAGRRTLGLAVDLGTTNVAGFLVDLQSGARLASLGIENPQVAWGADVISRMNHAIQGPAQRRGTAPGGRNRDQRARPRPLLFHRRQPRPTSSTWRSAATPPCTICCSACRCASSAARPSSPPCATPWTSRRANSISRVCPGAYVHMAPNIGGFVGSDHVTALLATQEHWRGGATTLVMDIGTNTEISLIHGGDILSASCPSGPALEGGHISCGMRAAEGAIERVDGRRRPHQDRRDRQPQAGRPVRLGRDRRHGGLAANRHSGRRRPHRRRASGHRRGGRQARGGAGAGRHLHPARRARGAARQGGDPHRHRTAAARPQTARSRHRARRHRRRLRLLYRRRQRHRHRPVAGAAARALPAGRQRRRRRRAADARFAADARARARTRASAAAMSS